MTHDANSTFGSAKSFVRGWFRSWLIRRECAGMVKRFPPPPRPPVEELYGHVSLLFLKEKGRLPRNADELRHWCDLRNMRYDR